MSIATRIEAIEQHITDDYSVLELAGADLTNVDKNIENLKQSWEERLLYFLANGTDVVWNNWLPKVTGTGETITLNNTIEAKMDFVYKGNTYQYSTIGKNLFNINTAHSNNLSDAGITATFNSDGTITVNGTKNANYKAISYNITLPAGTYYFSGCPSGGSGGGYSIIVQTTNEISSQIFDTGNGATFTLTEQKKISFFPVRVGADAVTFNNAVFKPMIARVPVTYNDYEPYTNGQSPNPDYPQEIQVVSGDNTIKVEGKNLFDTTKYNSNQKVTVLDNEDGVLELQGVSGWYEGVNQEFDVISNQHYILSYNAQKINTTAGIIVIVKEEDNITELGRNNNTGVQTISFTPTTGKINVFFRTNYETNTGHTKYSNIQLELGNQLSQYTPYQGQTYPISLGNIELCKIGNYQDKIYKDNGKWYLNKQIGKVVLDGSENWVHETGSQTPTPRTVVTINSINFLNNNYYSNYFILNSTTSNRIVLQTVNSQLYLSLENELTGIINSDTNQQKVDKIKSWLSTHNTTVYYVIATPTNEEITDSTLIYQLEAIKKSYNNQTNISQENSKEAFILDVTALGN